MRRRWYWQKLPGFFAKGRQKGFKEMIILQLSSRLGAMLHPQGNASAPEIEHCITQLSAEQLQSLAVAFLNFSSREDLVAWFDNLS